MLWKSKNEYKLIYYEYFNEIVKIENEKIGLCQFEAMWYINYYPNQQKQEKSCQNILNFGLGEPPEVNSPVSQFTSFPHSPPETHHVITYLTKNRRKTSKGGYDCWF